MVKTDLFRVKILTWLIALLFLVPGITDIGKGIRQGIAMVEIGHKDDFLKGSSSYAVTVEPVNYRRETLPATVGGAVLIEMQAEGMICLPDRLSQPLWMKIASILFVLTGLGTYVYLIFRVFVTVPSIVHAGLMNCKNIHRIRQIGVALVISSLCFYFSQAIDVFFVRSVTDLENYRVIYPSVPGELTVAFIILLLTEVLRIGYRLQEEQELTI